MIAKIEKTKSTRDALVLAFGYERKKVSLELHEC
jgi:hypothetical protein